MAAGGALCESGTREDTLTGQLLTRHCTLEARWRSRPGSSGKQGYHSRGPLGISSGNQSLRVLTAVDAESSGVLGVDVVFGSGGNMKPGRKNGEACSVNRCSHSGFAVQSHCSASMRDWLQPGRQGMGTHPCSARAWPCCEAVSQSSRPAGQSCR